MPATEEAIAVRVQEGEGGREIFVIIDDVGEVGHAFVTLIHWGGESGGVVGRWVNGVHCCLPALYLISKLSERNLCDILRQMLRYPAGLVFLELRHDYDFVTRLATKGRIMLNGAMMKSVLPRMTDE